MQFSRIKTLPLLLLLVCFFSSGMLAQKSPDCIKAAKITRPTFVLVSSGKLNKFADGEADFSKMKIVKSELAYYLLASEQNGKRIFAFELEQKGRRLFLNQKLPVQSCSEGELSLDTFLQEDGKITGCRMGNHTIIE
ncbi:MAG: hypothetical protein HY842_01865 [Bacteroidetes bacterium]|nr:hypothetical protein [Bacteroidota bacterium]